MNKLILVPLAALFLVSCGGTVQSRIEKNPELYQKLSTKHKVLVEKGRIARGMDKEAVFLAWGKPARVSDGENSKGRFERWNYTTLEPIYTHGFHGSFGRRYYRRGNHYGSRYGYSPGFSSNVHYIPRDSARVDFRNNRVADWQRGDHRGHSLYRNY